MEKLLKEQVAIVTGGTSGIGKTIAETFADAGASIAIFGIQEEEGKQTVEEFSKKGVQAQFYFVDVTDVDQVQKSVQEVIEAFGKIDVLVNNAGITKDNLLMRMDESDWNAVLDVNLKSCFHTCKAVLRPMMKARHGRIINISSVVGLMGNGGQANYAASKAGMIGFTKSLAKEVASRNILANCIAPGFIKTAMTDKLNEKQKEAILGNVPMQRLGEPRDVANGALFLASPLANYITGQVLIVDGGLVM